MSWKLSGGGGGGDSEMVCGETEGVSAAAAPAANSNGTYSYNNINSSVPPRWSELHARVKEMRRTYSQLFVKIPTNIKFRLISEDCLRIYFLLCPAQGREATLFFTDLTLSKLGSGCIQANVKEVLDTTNSFSWRRTSREEQLLSERRRCSVWGITHYQMHPDTGTLVFPAASTIFYCQHPKLFNGSVMPNELPSSKVRLNPKLCPNRPQLIAFSANNDVHIFNSKTGFEFRVSYCHNFKGRLELDPVSAGVPPYVMQEEFSRYNGYWWQPRSLDNVQRLLYEEVDESDVLIVQFMSHDQSSPEEFRFPRAGNCNAKSQLRLAELESDGSVIRVLHLAPELDRIAPWHQYLVRVGWTPCGQFVWVQMLERRQHRLDLLLLPLALFSVVAPTTPADAPQPANAADSGASSTSTTTTAPTGSSKPPPPPPEDSHPGYQRQQKQQSQQQRKLDQQQLFHSSSQSSGNAAAAPQQLGQTYASVMSQPSIPNVHGTCQSAPQLAEAGGSGAPSQQHQNGHIAMPYTLLTEQQEHTWIDVHDLLYWFKDEDSSIRTFIWGSEESGYRHLYLYRVRLAGGGAVQVQQKVPLTAGEWTVLCKGLWVDQPRGLVYFMALKDTPLEHHLYVISIKQAASNGPYTCPQRLTTLGYSHNVFLSTESQMFVSCYSSLTFPGSSQVFRLGPPDQPSQLVSAHLCADLLPNTTSDAVRELQPLVVPEIVPVELSSGVTLYSMIFKPHNFQPGNKYPVVLHIYGGPQVQLVTNTFKGCRHMRTHMLAAHGMCVISIDSRGSDNRGVSFQTHLRHRMGTVEVSDQVEALFRLKDRFSFIDLDRVGVFGWSYGGYLALMALAQQGHLFKVAIAGAPVVNWTMYDTGYTERYMDIPENNMAGYKNSSVLSFIKNFPDEEGRLLIVQGVIDENVHFCHTSALIQHLVNAGKPYQLQVYPRERHCLRQLDSNEHYETQLLHFLLKGL